jgi:DNA-directed RNA polymerase subunit RPC12/RpoP
MKQKFYCKECNKEFEVDLQEHYYNYKCPECGSISLPPNYTGIRFKGLPTIKG